MEAPTRAGAALLVVVLALAGGGCDPGAAWRESWLSVREAGVPLDGAMAVQVEDQTLSLPAYDRSSFWRGFGAIACGADEEGTSWSVELASWEDLGEERPTTVRSGGADEASEFSFALYRCEGCTKSYDTPRTLVRTWSQVRPPLDGVLVVEEYTPGHSLRAHGSVTPIDSRTGQALQDVEFAIDVEWPPDSGEPAETLACEDLRQAYRALLAAHRACEVDADCRLAGGQRGEACACEVALGSPSGDPINSDGWDRARELEDRYWSEACSHYREHDYPSCDLGPALDPRCEAGRCVADVSTCP